MNDTNLNEINYNHLGNGNNSYFYYIYNPPINNKSKSIDKARNTNNLITLLSKPWAYSYNKKKYSDNIINKKRKKSLSLYNLVRLDLFNNLYDDRKKE